MKAGEIIFQSLLNGDVQYNIPLFQRTYNWRESQWERLWDDLLEIYAMPQPKNHFIGSVVTHPMTSIAGGTSKFAVIDGQQRITTLLIILAVIRNRAKADPKELTTLEDQIYKSSLINEFAEGAGRIKLMPSRRDRDSFNDVVEGREISADTQVARAWIYFNNALSQGYKDQRIDLRKLYTCITSHLEVVSITLQESDNPNRIFESLNYAGMELTASDLIRNYLFMNIRDSDTQDFAYDKYWYPMQELLGSSSMMDNFFWRYLSMDGSLPRDDKDSIFNGVRGRLGFDPTDDATVKLLHDVHKFSHYYARIIGHNISGLDECINTRLRRLRVLRIGVAYPFLMKALDHISSDTITENQLAKVLRMVESFLVRRWVCGYTTRGHRQLFARMVASVDFHTDFVQSSKNHLLGDGYEGWGWPSDNRFRDRFSEFRLYVPSRLARTRLVLTSLERSFESKEMPKLTEDITIEHVMPQTLSDKWIATLGQDVTEVHNHWLDTVGNLTLTGYNPKLGNRCFSKKKKYMKDSNFALTKSIVESDTWNADTIQQRGRELAERALKIWPR